MKNQITAGFSSLFRAFRQLLHNGLQTALFCASGAHVLKSTLRAGSQKPPFSAHSASIADTLWAFW